MTILLVKNAKPGRHGDGQGLYLLVKESGARSWMLRVQVDGKRRDIGIGSITDLSLAEAREKSAFLRKTARAGVDPIWERDRNKRELAIPNFKAAAISCHKEMSRGWAEKTAAGFISSLEIHAFPKLGKISVDRVDGALIRDTLAPIWIDLPSMARKLMQRIGTVLSFSKSNGWRELDSPSPKEVTMGLAKQAKSKSFAAMPFVELPSFVSLLTEQPETMGRLALLMTIFTAARSGEVRQARWSHINLETKLWTRPADLMKSREEHIVTLSSEALKLLRHVSKSYGRTEEGLIFQGSTGKTLSDMTLSKVMRDADIPYTVHGFRSSFRDWAAEKMPTIPFEVAETAIAHAIGSKVTRSYLRTNFLEMRFQLANGWGKYCSGHNQNVLQLAV